MDTELLQQDTEGDIDDMSSSRRGPKKMKVVKAVQPQNERKTTLTVHT